MISRSRDRGSRGVSGSGSRRRIQGWSGGCDERPQTIDPFTCLLVIWKMENGKWRQKSTSKKVTESQDLHAVFAFIH